MAQTLDEVKARCRIEGKHWIWTGALSEGKWPRIYAPDYTDGGKMKSQPGRRAVWHLKTAGRSIPHGWRVFGCDVDLCISPECVVCQPTAKRGEKIAKTGAWKGNPKRIIANRLSGRKRSSLTPELIATISTSDKTGVELEAETGVSRQTISKVRTGRPNAYTPLGGLFTGLIAQ